MKSALLMTRATAASTSERISAYCAFRSTSGICSAADTLLLAPDIRPLEEAFEAHELCHLLEHLRRIAADHRAGGDVTRHHRARADERSCADLHAGQDGGVASDAHVILDRGAKHALEVARADGVGV